MKFDEKSFLYTRYISTRFGKDRQDTKDFNVHYQYYRYNYLKHLPADKNAKILDLGSGMGHFLNFLKIEGYKNYLGIDICEENIEFCKKNAFNIEKGNIFEYLRNTPDVYDAIIMNDIIEHLEKNEILDLLKTIFGKLNIGGRLIIKVPNASNPIMASSSRYSDFTHELLFTEESMSQVLQISGFTQISIFPQDLFIFYYNPLNYLGKLFNFLINGIFRILFRFYGRIPPPKIFTKNLIAVAVKD